MKKNKATSAHKPLKGNPMPKAPRYSLKERVLQRIPLLPTPMVFFAALWLYAGWWYADVFKIAEQYSFFAADSTLMEFTWNRPYGLLWIAGRALLSLFHYPILGGAVWALLLTATSYLIGYALRLPARWRALQYLPAGLYLMVLAYQGFDIYYQNETGMIMGIPFCLFVVVALQSLIIRSFSRKNAPAFVGVPTDESRGQNLLGVATCLLLVGASMTVTEVARPYVRPTCRMQCQMWEKDWEGMRQTALDKAQHSYRPLAAYHAIALTQTGRIGENLFDILYDYDEIHLHNRNNVNDTGNDLYQVDGNYYAGLLQGAYYKAMEYLTMEGPSHYMLKRMAQIALLRNEKELARKYLHILDQTPFEHAFVEEYTRYLNDPEQLEALAETKYLRSVEPVDNSFHTMYRQPLFLGYNIAMSAGRSLNALQNTIAACLYTKLMPDAMMRIEPLTGRTLPQNFADAVGIRAHKNEQMMQLFPGMNMNVARYRGFLKSVSPMMKNRQEHVRELFPQFKGYYPYYYYFGNLKITEKKKEDTTNDHKGVN